MTVKITRNGAEKIKNEINEFNERLKEIREEKAVAYTNSGDTWHDNPAFNSLEQEEKIVYAKIKELEKLLKTSELIEVDDHNDKVVQIGSIVLCHCVYPDFEEDMVLEICGFGESDLENGKICYDTPVGQALIGAKMGENLIVKTPIGDVSYEIRKLFKNWEEAKEHISE